jgi:hypothetical protein
MGRVDHRSEGPAARLAGPPRTSRRGRRPVDILTIAVRAVVACAEVRFRHLVDTLAYPTGMTPPP